MQASEKYQPFPAPQLPDRTWPSAQIVKAPVWCSVDLRDGNQALVAPMDGERKLRLLKTLLGIGFKEIEVGFPAASNTDKQFVQRIIRDDLLPSDATMQVLTQARQHLIADTFDSLAGAQKAIVHLYNSTSEAQRRIVFNSDEQGIIDIACRGAEQIKRLCEQQPDCDFTLQYSPESFSGTELEFALKICSAVIDIWQPTAAKPVIINLPSTVEHTTPNIYADQIEIMHRNLPKREALVLSVHPHNDRGTAVAAAELALMAGADRIEGTLFGNGERTGNVDIVTLALNLFTQGVNCKLDFSDIKQVRKVAEYCTNISTHIRHPYAGDLVFTAFSGSHQDAIKKGMAYRRKVNSPTWEVPYLPIDPSDIGRNYEPVIRVNSQSGKGGVAFIMEQEFGLALPRALQIEFSNIVQEHSDSCGTEITPAEIWQLFKQFFLPQQPLAYQDHTTSHQAENPSIFNIEAIVRWQGEEKLINGHGNGPVDSFIAAITASFGGSLQVIDYQQHAIGSSSKAKSATYLQVTRGKNQQRIDTFGFGIHKNITVSSLIAICSGYNRINALEQQKKAKSVSKQASR